MLLLDDREPSALCSAIGQLAVPVNCQARLEFGDCYWQGFDYETGEVCLIGVERKRISDLVSSMHNRRLSGHQLRGMWETYEDVRLIVEGAWRCGHSGELEVWRGSGVWGPLWDHRDPEHGDHATGVSFRQVASYITTLACKCGVYVQRTYDMNETAAWIASWWHASQKKEHHSGDQVYAPGPTNSKGHGSQWAKEHEHDEDFDFMAPDLNAGHGRRRGRPALENPTTLWRMAAQLPGIDRKARLVAEQFKTVHNMATASMKDWLEIEGVGIKTAEACVRAIYERGA